MDSKKLFRSLIGVMLFGLLLWGAMLCVTWEERKELFIDLGKTGASLSLITAVGGIVQWMMKNRELEKEKEEQQQHLYKAILTDLKLVYDKVERVNM